MMLILKEKQKRISLLLSAYVICLGCNIVAWSWKKQRIIGGSNSEHWAVAISVVKICLGAFHLLFTATQLYSNSMFGSPVKDMLLFILIYFDTKYLLPLSFGIIENNNCLNKNKKEIWKQKRKGKNLNNKFLDNAFRKWVVDFVQIYFLCGMCLAFSDQIRVKVGMVSRRSDKF